MLHSKDHSKYRKILDSFGSGDTRCGGNREIKNGPFEWERLAEALFFADAAIGNIALKL